MDTVEVKLPAELMRAAGVNPTDPSRDTARLLALELYRENKLSLGRAAELSQTPIENFIEFASHHEAPIHYGLTDLEDDRQTLARLGL